MEFNEHNTIYEKGVENLLVLPDGFDPAQFISINQQMIGYGCKKTTETFEKMKLCNHLCALSNDELKQIMNNLHSEIQKLLLIK